MPTIEGAEVSFWSITSVSPAGSDPEPSSQTNGETPPLSMIFRSPGATALPSTFVPAAEANTMEPGSGHEGAVEAEVPTIAGAGSMKTPSDAVSVPAVATIVTCVSLSTVSGAVYVAPLEVSLDRVPTGFPNAVCRLQMTSPVVPDEIVTVTD